MSFPCSIILSHGNLFYLLKIIINIYTEEFTKYKPPPAWMELLNSLSYHWTSTVQSVNSDEEKNVMGLLLHLLISSLVSEIWKLWHQPTLWFFTLIFAVQLLECSWCSDPRRPRCESPLTGCVGPMNTAVPSYLLHLCHPARACVEGAQGEAVNLMILSHFRRDSGELEGRRGKIQSCFLCFKWWVTSIGGSSSSLTWELQLCLINSNPNQPFL